MIEQVPINVTPGPQLLAWWVGYSAMAVGFYFIFICERSDLDLMAFGLLIALFGDIVYILVRSPEWFPEWIGTDTVLTLGLMLLLLIMGYTIRLVWTCYNLKPPWTRLLEISRPILRHLRP